MPIFHDVAQYSELYDRLRLGIPTSSHFHKIITPQGKPSKQWREYACVLIAERILQRNIEFYNSPAMERGLIVEAEAADWYEFDQDVTTQRVGFITDDDNTTGCSPDQLYITQRSCVDILCWHDVLPKLVMRVEPDAAFIKALDHERQIFNYFVEGVVEKIRATHQLPMPPGGLALRAALRQPRNHSVICPAFPPLRGASRLRDGHNHDFAIKQRAQRQPLEWP